ncbi:Superfamily II DNA and RNA helicase [Selenomonas sp. WCT3]|uniref:DEAD/DEAH box helicase n=1 Tax=Selenomonas sp. WCT3 TaxID=3158785 RepID=UPI00087F1BE2|nr:Superfamily II DNA and RNA helicase [Selenomonas ruminantium]
MTTFADLGITEALCEALTKQGLNKPTEIQEKTIGKVLAGQNLVGQAPTGTGKTLAYLLPAMQQIDPEIRQAQVLILAPTYELAMQIANVARELSQQAGLGVKVQGIIGGANIARQMDKLKEKPQLIVGSAGRIIELSRKGKLKLQQVKLLVLDEFDRLLDDQNLDNTVEMVKLLPKDRQVILFSATAPKKAMERADFLESPEHVIVKEDAAVMEARENYYLMTPFRDKIENVRKLTRNLGVKRGLVFINRVFDAEKTLAHLQYDGIRAASLLGHQNKQARQKAIADLKKGKIQLLLSTDLAARGLDIEGVDYVFNLDLPESAQVYQHRAGRTARAGAKGTVVTLADIKEAYKLEQLEKRLGISFKPIKKAKGQTKPQVEKKKKNRPYKAYKKKATGKKPGVN